MAGEAILKPIVQKVVQNIPQLAAKALSVFSGNSMRVIPAVTEAAAGVASTTATVADSGVWQVVGKVRRSLSDDLQNLLHTIDATAEQKGLFDKVSSILRERDACLSDADRNSLMDALNQLSQGKNPGEVILNPAQQIEQLKGQVTQLTDKAKSVSLSISERIKVEDVEKGIKATTLEQDVDTLSDACIDVLHKELSRGNTWIGLAWQFGGANAAGAPEDPKMLPAFLRDKLINGDFTAALRRHLSGEKGVGDSLTDYTQKKAFKVVTTSIWAAKHIPENVRFWIQRVDLFAQTPAMGFAFKIPGIGHFLKWGYGLYKHFVVDYLTLFGDDIEVGAKIAKKYLKE